MRLYHCTLTPQPSEASEKPGDMPKAGAMGGTVTGHSAMKLTPFLTLQGPLGYCLQAPCDSPPHPQCLRQVPQRPDLHQEPAPPSVLPSVLSMESPVIIPAHLPQRAGLKPKEIIMMEMTWSFPSQLGVPGRVACVTVPS